MKCLNCNNERRGRSAYCGDTCRVVWNRNKKRNTESLVKSVTPESVTVSTLKQPSPLETVDSFASDGVTGITEADQELATSDQEITRLMASPKRGKDIKVFADLPPDVQATIIKMSKAGGMMNGKIDQTIKANRTAIAINYQHQFPDQYFPHNELRLTPVGRVGDTKSEWMEANRK